jgi:hypothetical protein
MTLSLAATAFASRTAAQDNVWRDNQEFETRRAALNRVEHHDTASRYRRRLTIAPRLVDIKRLRAINDELTRLATSGGSLDFKSLAKSAAEINKCAKRLQAGLRFDRSKDRDDQDDEAQPQDLRASLALLRSSIESLADSPIFKKAPVIDIRLSAKAADDLKKVIESSGQVERACRKLASSTAIH